MKTRFYTKFGGKQVFHVICTWMAISDHNPYEHEFETTWIINLKQG